MQANGERCTHKHSLLNMMNRFIAAANNMDETIMVPSLLRDVPLEEHGSESLSVDNDKLAFHSKQRDMYERYLLLKSIRNDMEWGLFRQDMANGSYRERAIHQEEDPCGGLIAGNEDLEDQLHYHLRGLFGILSKLTVQADRLTNRYKREIGGGNFIR